MKNSCPFDNPLEAGGMISVYHAAEVEDVDKEVVEPIYIEDEVVSCTSGMTDIYRSSCVSQIPGSDDE